MKHALWMVVIALALSAIACNRPGQPTPPPITPTYTPHPAVTRLPNPAATEPTVEATAETVSVPAGWLTYRDEARGFEVSYPDSGVPINTNPPAVGNQDSVRIDLPFTPNTNLGEKYLQIDWHGSQKVCISPALEGFEPGDLESEVVTIGGIRWQKVSRTGVAAGNVYEFTAYSVMQNGACVILTFVLHSFDVGNLATPPAEFDHAAESAVFEQIVATFRWLP